MTEHARGCPRRDAMCGEPGRGEPAYQQSASSTAASVRRRIQPLPSRIASQ
jgi:hypothetical protein